MEMARDNSYRTTIAIIFAIVLTCLAIILRLAARSVNANGLGSDDYTMILAAVFTIGNAITFIYGLTPKESDGFSSDADIHEANKYGNGKLQSDVSEADYINYWKAYYAAFQLYGVAVTLTKLSVLLLIRRVFTTPKMRMLTIAVGIPVLAWLIANNFAAAFQCNPIRKAWDREVPGSCANPLAFVIGIQVPNVVLDAAVLVIPISAVQKLQMSKRKRVLVTGIFALGGLSVVVAIIRLVVLVATSHVGTRDTGKPSWTTVEPALEVVAGCLPTYGPFLIPRQFISNFSSSLKSHNERKHLPRANKLGQTHQFDLVSRTFIPSSVRLHEIRTVGTTVAGNASVDEFPKKSIHVRQDIDWEEHRRDSVSWENDR